MRIGFASEFPQKTRQPFGLSLMEALRGRENPIKDEKAQAYGQRAGAGQAISLLLPRIILYMNYKQNMKIGYFFLLSLFMMLVGCEITSSDLTEVDENGNRVNNNEIRIGSSLLDIGMTAYAIDTVCTELLMTRQKGGAVKITGFRKGTVVYDENGAIDSIAWDWRQPEVRYGYDFRYVWGDYEYRILSLEDHGFVEDMEIWKRGKGGEKDRLYAQLTYAYDYAGYISEVEIPNLETTVLFKYHYRDQMHYANSISITEVHRKDSTTYTLALAPGKIRNTGYVCNVLRYAGSPVTNEYILNHDLYSRGIYGTPVKFLPDAIIERSIYRDGVGDLRSVYSRVGADHYFYEDNAILAKSRRP